MHICFLKPFEINIFPSHSNHPSSLPLELIHRFLYNEEIRLKQIKIQLCEVKMFVVRIRSRTLPKSKLEISVKFLKEWKLPNHKKLHLRCYSGPRSRELFDNLHSSFMRQVECSSKWFQLCYSNVP